MKIAESLAESQQGGMSNQFFIRELADERAVIDYVRYALIPEMRTYNVPITPHTHYTRLSSAVFEGVSKVVDSGKEFLKAFEKQDQRNNMKISVGSMVSILNMRMSQEFIELFGFKSPKKITKIYREPTDHKIIQLEFNNDPEDVWPRQPLASYNGQTIMTSALFPGAAALETALTTLYLSKPNDLTIRSNISETVQDVAEGWKSMAAGAALAGAAALGSQLPTQTPQSAQSVQGQVTTPATNIVAQKKAASKDLTKLTAPHKPAASSTSVTGNPKELLLKKVAIASGIKGTELAAFLAQCAHESMDFSHMKEIGGSLDFKKYDPRFAPRKAAELGNDRAGDGALYKGRGFIQITGRENYRKAGKALGLPLEKHPELAEKPEVAAKVAVWYWKHRVKPHVDNFEDTRAVTKHINSGLLGLADRHEYFKDFKVAVAPKLTNKKKV